MPETDPNVVSFPRFYETARHFIQEALRIMETQYGSPPQWPTYPFLEADFKKTGTGHATQISTGSRPWPTGLMLHCWVSHLSKLPSCRGAEGELQKLAVARKAVGHMSSDIGMAYLGPMLSKYIDASMSLKFEDHHFYQAYMPIETYLSSDEIESRLFFELSGLNGQVQEVVLSPTHRIIELDVALAQKIWTLTQATDFPVTSMLAQTRKRMHMTPGQIVLESVLRTPKSEINRLSLALSAEKSRSALALRLCKVGGGAVRFVDYEHIGFVPSMGRIGFLEEPRQGLYSYALDESAAEQIAKTWPTAYQFSGEIGDSSVRTPLPLEIAAGRFMTSFEKNSREDRLLDYVIAIEALYGREDRDISYRVPLRAAAVIGRDPGDRKEVFDMVRAAYRTRSTMAHGQGKLDAPVKVGRTKVATKEFLLRIQDYLIQSVHLFLRAHRQKLEKEGFLKAIDNAILTQDRAELEELIGA